MTIRRALTLAFWLTGAAAVLPGRAAAQTVPPPPPAAPPQTFVPQPQYYLLTTDAADGRALWVQPAGMAKRRREASISGLLTASHAGDFKIGQYGVTISSGGLALGWQHDRLPNGIDINAYAAGLAAGNARVAVGADHRWYKGALSHGGSWDLGVGYQALPALELSTVWRDLGSPAVGGGTINATLVPGAALRLWGGRARLGLDWEVVTNGWSTSALRAGAGVRLPLNLALNLRSEFDGRLSARSFAVALSWSPVGARVAVFDATERAPQADQVGIWGAAVSTPIRRRRFGG